MAKVSCNYISKINSKRIDELHKPIVFVVDMINGFIKEGSLSDANIMDVCGDIEQLLKEVKPSIFVCDAHDLNSKEFKSFPIHCIKNTSESQVIDELKPYAKTVYYKNSTNAFFQEQINLFVKNEIQDYNDIVIVGCCSDICILQFALTLNTYLNQNEMIDQNIIVPINMIETYHIDSLHDAMKWNEVACDMMLANGIEVVELKCKGN